MARPKLLRRRQYLIRIFFPTMLALGLIITADYTVIIPTVERQLLTQKKEVIAELTNAAWSILAEFAAEVERGALNLEEAQQQAKTRIQDLRYGKERKDYFWITDLHPTMIMHPYRTDLNGQDLTEFKDLKGNRVFVEFVNRVREREEDYSEYYWQWKDDPERIVPKLSYIKRFAPWDWVIGTGLYTDDVNREIQLIAGRIFHISLAVAGLMMFILLFIAHQSLRIDLQRSQAEAALHASHDKYRSLVEATTEGLVMVLDGTVAYANRTLGDMVGYTEADLNGLAPTALFTAPTSVSPGPGSAIITEILEGGAVPPPFETQLVAKDGSPVDVIVTVTKIELDDKTGFIFIVKDISRSDAAKEEYGSGLSRFKVLAEAVELGVFRTTVGSKAKVLDANKTAAVVCGYPSVEDLLATNILDLVFDPDDRNGFFTSLSNSGITLNQVVRIRRPDRSVATVGISAVLVRDPQGKPQACEGIIQDITVRRQTDDERESLLSELQASLLFLNQPISGLGNELLFCELHTSIRAAAEIMTANRTGAVAVQAAKGEVVGVVTDTDMRERVVAGGYDFSRQVFEIMSAPVVSISNGSLVYEALTVMHDHAISHLAVHDTNRRIVGLVHRKNLLQFNQYSAAVITWEIQRAKTANEIIATRTKRTKLVKALIECGAKARIVNRILSTISDAAFVRFLTLAITELGPPPAAFAFMALGSEGRGEQTLVTDQDNALVYEDQAGASAKEYFLALSTKACDWMHQAGYTYCKGDVMAKNPRWCLPVPLWQEQFSQWITTAVPQDLLEFNIFFDFRCIYGAERLTAELRRFISSVLSENPTFFLLSAENTLLYKPPIGLFGNIVMESGGEKPNTFNIKDAMLPIVNFARIYALRYSMEQINTIERLDRLFELDKISPSAHRELVQAYEHLMQLRLRHQATALDRNVPPDNHLSAQALTRIDRAVLKQAFSLISTLQKKISYDFKGVL